MGDVTVEGVSGEIPGAACVFHAVSSCQLLFASAMLRSFDVTLDEKINPGWYYSLSSTTQIIRQT